MRSPRPIPAVVRGVTLAALAGLVACDSGQPQSRWAEPFEQLGLIPVEPANEDVRVGDMFVYVTDPEGERGGSTRNVDRRIGAVSRWTSLPITDALEQEYEGRRALPPTRRWTALDRERGAWPEATTGGDSIFAPGDIPVRLRHVTLPTGARAIGTDFVEAMIPPEVVALTTGKEWEDTKGLTLTIGSAELYSLSIDALLSLVVEAGEDGGYVLKEEYRRRLPVVAQLSSGHVWIRVLSQVLYVRSLHISIDSVHIDSMEDVPPPDLTAAPRPEVEKPALEGDPLLIPYERAGHVNRLLEASGADSAPGVATRVVSATEKGVTLRRIWQYPLAIAARGVTLEVNSSTGAVVRTGTIGQPWSDRPLATAPEPPADSN